MGHDPNIQGRSHGHQQARTNEPPPVPGKSTRRPVNEGEILGLGKEGKAFRIGGEGPYCSKNTLWGFDRRGPLTAEKPSRKG